MIEKFCVGMDVKGNRIEYIRQPDGSWLNALTEQLWPDALVRQYFPELVAEATCPEPECSCVLPEQSCPVCREAARRAYDLGDYDAGDRFPNDDHSFLDGSWRSINW